jgi:transcriptional regulator with XRE-family HTH domain
MGEKSKLLELLGLDLDDADQRLHVQLAEEDHELIQELVRMRRDKGLLQTDVAAKMQRDKSAVSNFERLGGDPHMSTVRRYAQAIGVRIHHRVEDAEPSTVERNVLRYAANVIPMPQHRVNRSSLKAVYEQMEAEDVAL